MGVANYKNVKIAIQYTEKKVLDISDEPEIQYLVWPPFSINTN